MLPLMIFIYCACLMLYMTIVYSLIPSRKSPKRATVNQTRDFENTLIALQAFSNNRGSRVKCTGCQKVLLFSKESDHVAKNKQIFHLDCFLKGEKLSEETKKIQQEEKQKGLEVKKNVDKESAAVKEKNVSMKTSTKFDEQKMRMDLKNRFSRTTPRVPNSMLSNFRSKRAEIERRKKRLSMNMKNKMDKEKEEELSSD